MNDVTIDLMFTPMMLTILTDYLWMMITKDKKKEIKKRLKKREKKTVKTTLESTTANRDQKQKRNEKGEEKRDLKSLLLSANRDTFSLARQSKCMCTSMCQFW